MVAHRSVSSAWGIGGLVPLLSIAAAYLLVGIGAFILGQGVANSRGSLGRY
jgi:hypothetical protein